MTSSDFAGRSIGLNDVPDVPAAPAGSAIEVTEHPWRRRYTDEALLYLPRLFQMVDRNQYSPTYGSFDRSYWHYRTMDFPCGMYQEFVLPLALAHTHPFPDNPYYGVERVRELAMAGVHYARKSAHRDGSCDDYFPYERALGALVFSLHACTETLLVLGDRTPALLEFFMRRGDHLRAHNETGQLTNHQALAALALYNVYMLTGEDRFRKSSNEFVDIVRAWQSDEGWFQEYEGADPGYHSCTIAFLAKLFKKSKDEKLLDIMKPAVDFAWHFMHPDGSYAGEYGSRNTYHFYPHGFEVMAAYKPEAAQIADQFLDKGLPLRTRYFNDDDRMCAHYLYDWMQSYLDFSEVRSPQPLNDRPPYQKYFEKARIYVQNTGRYHAVLSLAKGGVLKVTTEDGPLYSDTGLIGRSTDGTVIVSHIVDDYEVKADLQTSKFSAAGRMCRRKSKLATPFTQIIFRLINLTLGRFAPNLLRSLLQKVLITGKKRTNYEFARDFEFLDDFVIIRSRMKKPPGSRKLESLHIASDATSIYVANSNVYQHSVLLPWRELSQMRDQVNTTGEGEHTLTIKPPKQRA
ncbi:MAG: hypothetical protein K1X53_15515 [Candidatus Sumerlaeaceae bacterium]|nr:hypothetical protein [Candidatus Sumerlaeaceae bacterium]